MPSSAVPIVVHVEPALPQRDTTPTPGGKRERQDSLDIDTRSAKKKNTETQFLSNHQDLSGHAHAKDTSHATEDVYIREELQNLPNREIPYEPFLDVVLEGWRPRAGHAVASAATSPQFIDAMRRYEVAAAENKEKHTSVTEKALYSPFCDMVDEIMKIEGLPYQYFDTHKKKIPNLEKWKHDPDRRPDGILVSCSQVLDDITWAHVQLMVEFKAHSSNYPRERTKSRKTASSSSSSHPQSHRSSSGASPRPKKITLTAQEQLACYAMEVMSSTGVRRHCLGVYVDNDQMQLWYFDRSGPIGSASVPFGDNYSNLTTLISALGHATESQLGFEPFILRNPSPLFGSAIEIDESTKFTISDSFKKNSGRYLIGPGTSVWSTCYPETTARKTPNAVIKLSWADPDREPEDKLIKHAREQGVSGIPAVCATLDLARLSQGYRGRLQPLLHIGKDVDDRVLRLIILQPNCIPLQDVPNLRDFMKAFISLVTTHYELYSKAKILHRNVALNNLLYDRDTGRGVLIDYQQAIRTDLPRYPHRSQYRVPSTPFLSLDLCLSEIPKHLYRHDLESFYWILWWIGMKYDWNGHIDNSYGRDWYSGTYEKIRTAKKGHLDQTSIVLTHKFAPLRGCLYRLSNLFSDAYGKLKKGTLVDNETVDGIVTFDNFVDILSSWNS